MHDAHDEFHDVVISGAGPVGLFLACELQLAGCSVLVLEQAQEPHSPLKKLPFGPRGLFVPTIESFECRDLLTAFQDRAASGATPAAAHWMQQKRRPGGHFAGIQFYHDQIDTAKWTYRLPGSVSNIAADMPGIEAVLTARAELLGVHIQRGCGIDGFEQSDEGVIVRAGGEAFRGHWLVGCDGARIAARARPPMGRSDSLCRKRRNGSVGLERVACAARWDRRLGRRCCRCQEDAAQAACQWFGKPNEATARASS